MKSLTVWLLSVAAFIAAGAMGFLTFWIFVGGIAWLGVTTFLLAWNYLAPTNRWWTFVKEGTAKVVIRGDKFEKVLIQWEGRTLSRIRIEDPYGKVTQDVGDVVEEKEGRHPLGGFRYYGFWPIKDIYTYRFKWSGVAEDGRVISHPPEVIDFVLLKDDVYWAEVDNAEDSKLLPLTVELILTIRIVNPQKALFGVQNWLETVINRIKPAVRSFVAQNEYETLTREKAVMSEKLFNGLKEEGLLEDEFKNRYGVEVRRVQVKDINPPDGYREKTLAPYLADMDRQAVVIKAEGEKRATVLRAEGEEERIEKIFSRISKFGELGKLIRTLEAAEKSPLAASLTVQAVPGLPEALRGIFGKGPEAVSSQEFARLREIVERLAKK